jgi:hypothetical protein
MPSRALSTLFVIASLAGSGGAGAAPAQQAPNARLRGTISDATTSKPVAQVRVVVGATGRFAVSDSLGRFELAALPSGILRFFFSRQGYPTTSVVLAFAPGETMVQAFEMDSSAATIAGDTLGGRRAQMLPTEEVRAPVERGVRYADFERRMRTGSMSPARRSRRKGTAT